MSVSPARTLVAEPGGEWVEQARRLGEAMEARVPGHKVSALQDLERGRRLEIEETFGYAVREASEMGLQVPSLDACYRLLAGLSRGAGSGEPERVT